MLEIIFFVIGFLVALELLIHMIYHWKTGKAGLYDPPFAYLKDIFKPKKHRFTKNEFAYYSNAMTDAVLRNDIKEIEAIVKEMEHYA